MISPISFPAHGSVLSEAVSNTRATAEASAMVNVIGAMAAVLDMSDPDHEAFADSAADCLDALLAHEPEIRRILASLAGAPRASASVAHISHHPCQPD